MVISERVLKLVFHVIPNLFRDLLSKDLAGYYRDYLLRTCTVVFSADVKKEMVKLRKLIKDKDLEQLAVVKKYGIKFLVAYDRDFEGIEEYITPQAFIKEMGIKAAASCY